MSSLVFLLPVFPPLAFPYQVKALHAAWCLLEGLIHTGYKKTQSSSLFFFLHFSLLNFTIYIHLQKEHERPATNIPDPLPSLWNVKPAPLYRGTYIKVCTMTDRSHYKTVTWNSSTRTVIRGWAKAARPCPKCPRLHIDECQNVSVSVYKFLHLCGWFVR